MSPLGVSRKGDNNKEDGMRGLIAVTFVLAVTAGAGTINVVSSFDPRFNPGGPWTRYAVSIEYDGRNLWTTVDGYFLKRTYPQGSIITTYNVGDIWSGGLAYDGTYLYTTDVWDSFHIYKFDPERGTIVGSFPYTPGLMAGGLTYGGRFLYFTEYLAGYLYKLNTGGSIVSSFHLGFERPWGLAYVEKAGAPYLFCATHPYRLNLQSMVYCITTTGSILGSAVWPVAGPTPDYGAAGLGYDGVYLWGIHNDGGAVENLALQMLYVTDIGVKPASAGRIKALFR